MALSAQPQARYAISLDLSDAGNELHQNGETEQAAAFYSQAIDYLSSGSPAPCLTGA